jgi:hypothetical protein
MVNWLSLAVPFAYLGVLIGSLATFSSLYRKRKARTSSSALLQEHRSIGYLVYLLTNNLLNI